MLEPLAAIGRRTLTWLARLGRAALLLVALLREASIGWQRPRLVVEQLHAEGVHSLLIIIVAGLFVGMVLGLQGYNTLVHYGATGSLGWVVAQALLRELGPVVAALLFAGRAGSALTAEVGLMKSGEQLAALEMMAVDPIRRLLAPRFLAGLIALPLLTAIFSLCGVLGGWWVGVGLLGVDDGTFWGQMQAQVALGYDLGNSVLKSLVFALLVSWIALFEGYDCTPTPYGVGRATTRSVVHASLAVLGVDFLLTALMFTEV